MAHYATAPIGIHPLRIPFRVRVNTARELISACDLPISTPSCSTCTRSFAIYDGA